MKFRWLLVGKAVTRLIHFKVLRNRLRNIGGRVTEPKARGRDTLVLYNVELAEVAGNIVWGKNNDVNDPIYNSCAFNEAQGFLNTVFNNTFVRCGVGLHI